MNFSMHVFFTKISFIIYNGLLIKYYLNTAQMIAFSMKNFLFRIWMNGKLSLDLLEFITEIFTGKYRIVYIYIYWFETSIQTSARHIAVFDMCWRNSTYGIIFLRLVVLATHTVLSHTQHVTSTTTIKIYAFSPITPLRFIPRAVF